MDATRAIAARSVKILPPGYKSVGTLDLSTDKKAFVLTQLGAVVLFVAFAWLFTALANVLRQDHFDPLAISPLAGLAGLAIGFVLMVVLHEGAHGLFFWLFTRQRPRFGFKLAYAYAAAPDWYIPRNLYLVVSLAPLSLLSGAGVVLFPVLPDGALFVVLTTTILNAAGSVGDLAVAVWALIQPRAALVRDTGDAVTIYVPGDRDGG